MRVFTSRFEYVIDCKCGAHIGFDLGEKFNLIRCPKCGCPHRYTGKEQLYSLDPVRVHYNTKKLELKT